MSSLIGSVPPVGGVRPSVRDLVAAGVLVQRELVDQRRFASELSARGLGSPDRVEFERWDREGLLSPLCFVRGHWTHWHFTSPYPTDGIEFRDETEFRPWTAYEFRRSEERSPVVMALYSEWQVTYVAAVIAATVTSIPVAVAVKGGDDLLAWAEGMRPFLEVNMAVGARLHSTWLPVVKVMLRLQARYWPYVCQRGALLYEPHSQDSVDPLDREYESHSAADVLTELGLEPDDIEALYRYFVWRGRWLDPTFRLYDLMRLEPRRKREAQTGQARLSLDNFDAAEMFRRFYRELTDVLLPDIDQLDGGRHEPEDPRPFRRDAGALDVALRRHRLYPHRLHIVAEGESEVRLVKRLFEAFAGRPWKGSGLEITDLGGDKLGAARPMLAGFGVYAATVALLLDDENDVARITQQLKQSGIVASLHETLCKPSLEEENFSAQELIDLVGLLASGKGVKLRVTESELLARHEAQTRHQRKRRGLADVLLQMAGSPDYGPVLISKPELADAMADALIAEVEDSEGRHDEVARRRPIVRWVLAVPLQAFRA